ncbi:hypothetical protein SCD_n00262 [Sulfuricella denitrificans skB26]|uniref:N-acetyltransferase domain-containing protein n=1 Tax=Sulfuricella denitrificans (strain DSM 22764 / NBRC 105220 / skB26) TaxID=1163617 RepID=S6AEC8_SULDS|nr:GNAT family N-acetyltransferase [Sulfuricella denitrificans]BAN34111.1 hypothetical protein SCD_n00262 [Sulfuricella denitrificans skB26]
MKTTLNVPLFNPAQGIYVEASLHERIDAGFARRADELWKAHIKEIILSGRTLEKMEHDHWKWESKVANSANLLSCPTFAIEYNNEPQGLMLLTTDGYFSRLDSQKGTPLVYVTYLACAPWNDRNIAETRRFKGVGTILMRAAIETSIDIGFKGRIGLHSLPQSEEFYENCGLDFQGIDASVGNLKYFELSQKAATEFLR